MTQKGILKKDDTQDFLKKGYFKQKTAKSWVLT